MPDARRTVATVPLYVDGVLAHAPGDFVPPENVERNGWADGVAKEGTKAADTAAPNEPIPPPPPK